MKKLRRYFLTGIAALLPLSVTVFIIYFIVRQLGGVFRPLLRQADVLARLPDWVATLAGFVCLVILILIVGAIASGVLGRVLLGWFDRLLRQIPVIKGIYGSARQFTDAVFVERNSLRSTVLAEYPRPGLWAVGFLTGDEPMTLPDGRRALFVFFPTTPNPTTGWLAIIPETDIRPAGMSIEDGLKLIVSGGVVRPPARG